MRQLITIVVAATILIVCTQNNTNVACQPASTMESGVIFRLYENNI